MRIVRRAAWALPLAVAACATTHINYRDPTGPRYTGGAPVVAAAPDQLHLVTFNIKFAWHVNEAIALLRGNDSLRGADVLLLQEMDARGVQAIADSLGLAWVYYPATNHPYTHRDLGNAILSRWPMEEDGKVVLPYQARLGHTTRNAVTATIHVGRERVRIYSVHLATMFGNGPNQRRDQLRAVLDDAAPYPYVIIGGDFNSETVPEVALASGYQWPTRRLPHTNSFWTFDHLLLKGVTLADSASLGIVKDVRGASDHKPVWAVLRLTEDRRAGL